MIKFTIIKEFSEKVVLKKLTFLTPINLNTPKTSRPNAGTVIKVAIPSDFLAKCSVFTCNKKQHETDTRKNPVDQWA